MNTRDGQPVTALQPYLGAFGHLVALREGDLAYLHVHPEGAVPSPGDHGGPTVPFAATAPPDSPVRPPEGTSATRCWRAQHTMPATSSTEAGSAIARGAGSQRRVQSRP